MNITERIKNILLKPKEEWQIIAAEATSIAELYRNYIFILAAIGPVASFIGMSLVGVSLPVGGTFRVSIARGLASAVVHYGLALAAVYILAMIIDALAPTFSGEKNLGQAFKLAMYSSVPGWLAGVFALIPAIPRDPGVVRALSPLHRVAGSHEIPERKIDRIYDCRHYRGHCYVRRDRRPFTGPHCLTSGEKKGWNKIQRQGWNGPAFLYEQRNFVVNRTA